MNTLGRGPKSWAEIASTRTPEDIAKAAKATAQATAKATAQAKAKADKEAADKDIVVQPYTLPGQGIYPTRNIILKAPRYMMDAFKRGDTIPNYPDMNGVKYADIPKYFVDYDTLELKENTYQRR